MNIVTRGLEGYSELFPYLSYNETIQLVDELNKHNIGSYGRKRIVNEYSRINERRREVEILISHQNKAH